MRCPNCSKKTQVVDVRLNRKNFTRRRRKCPLCELRFTTLEMRIDLIPQHEIQGAILDFQARLNSIFMGLERGKR